jgi:hypothetical protein
MLKGDVVGMDDNSSGHHVADPGRHRGLAVVAASIHGQHGGTARISPVRLLFGHCLSDGAQQFHAPRSGFGLFRG